MNKEQYDENKCAMCLYDFELNNKTTTLDCNHKYHTECLNISIEKGYYKCASCQKLLMIHNKKFMQKTHYSLYSFAYELFFQNN